MLVAFVVSVVADAASPETAPAEIAIGLLEAAVTRPLSSTVTDAEVDADP
jgi:hypothetical protein